jgi:hypothetical protein
MPARDRARALTHGLVWLTTLWLVVMVFCLVHLWWIFGNLLIAGGPLTDHADVWGPPVAGWSLTHVGFIGVIGWGLFQLRQER